MLTEAITWLLETLAVGAVDRNENIELVHDGEPARYLLLNRVDRIVFGSMMVDGDRIRFHRSLRLIMQPIDRVLLHPLYDVCARWEVQ